MEDCLCETTFLRGQSPAGELSIVRKGASHRTLSFGQVLTLLQPQYRLRMIREVFESER